MLAGHVRVGGTVSVMVMVWVQLAVLPLPSVAVQVRVITPVSPQAPANESVKFTVGVPQLSVAVGVPCVPGAVFVPQVTVLFGGQVMTGGVLSRTTTDADAWLSV